MPFFAGFAAALGAQPLRQQGGEALFPRPDGLVREGV